MKTKIANRITYWLGVAAVGLIVGLSIQFVQAWTEPTDAPPGGNVGAPINTGGITQTKLGGLGIGGNMTVLGSVGIGTTSPTQKLEIVGGPTKTTGGLIIETRTSDPVSPETGRMWLRTDL